MRQRKYNKRFRKRLNKLKGQQHVAAVSKIKEILECEDINHYKNLRYGLKGFKRVHVNTSFVIVFCVEDDVVYFVDYEHHDVVYNKYK